jgi:hypothetical protein
MNNDEDNGVLFPNKQIVQRGRGYTAYCQNCGCPIASRFIEDLQTAHDDPSAITFDQILNAVKQHFSERFACRTAKITIEPVSFIVARWG